MNPVNSDGSLAAKKVQTFCDTSNYLYKILIGKIKEKYPLPERLIIVPDDMLNNLAFDALLIRISGQGNDIPLQVNDDNFLVSHHAISYCFSANLLKEMCKTKKDNKLRLSLALFAPSFHAESISLPFLNNQKVEIEEIHKIIPNSTIDLKSTKERFISGANKFAYLHISTHGYVSSDPDQSYLAFSQHSAKTDTSQLFFLKELYNYQMDQELITMTACETALGQQREGEGNISLARGFAYAGVRSFVTTLWKIPTNGATKIVPTFYNFLFNSHQTKDVALANSKRSFLKTGKNIYPENWAGLILIGNTKSVIITNSSHLLAWIVSGSLIIVFLFWIRIFRK
ncbi:MAG: CHAT domain-containing protein [Saprospiraceae bacterium]|uniref:CHAT domain-containing protein n=1 Tax=Candidatus Defluviibacterium haderslevense TaxID=2981993 RepID=A0A9D7SCC8_9BACT|nr:CHAT domain-containing protein [Candidatus Defluviibacterium haderslevense]